MKKSGFSLIEIIVAIGLAAIFIPAIGSVLSFSLRTSSQGEKFSKAYALAQEGMEAIMNLKSQNDANWDWSITPSDTSPAEYYQPTQTGGVWSLGAKTTTPGITQEPFTRTVGIYQVRRCGTDICTDELVPPDNTTRKITVTVSWPEQSPPPQKVELNAYVTQR